MTFVYRIISYVLQVRVFRTKVTKVTNASTLTEEILLWDKI